MTTWVLLPGLDGTGDLFAPLIRALGARASARVIRYPVDRPMDYRGHVDFARAQLPAPTDGPYLLLGESFSGPVAMALAAEAPPGLRGLALCCTFARTPRPRWAGLAPLTRIAPIHQVPAAWRDALLLGRFATPALSRDITKAVQQVRAEVLRSRLAAVARVDMSAALRSIRVPILDLRATEDRLVPRASADLIRQTRPTVLGAELVGPHALLQACPEAAAERLLEFQQVAR